MRRRLVAELVERLVVMGQQLSFPEQRDIFPHNLPVRNNSREAIHTQEDTVFSSIGNLSRRTTVRNRNNRRNHHDLVHLRCHIEYTHLLRIETVRNPF